MTIRGSAQAVSASPDGNVRAALVGCGVIGQQHAQVMARLPGLAVAAVVDVVEPAAARLADLLGGLTAGAPPRVHTSLTEALAVGDIDLVCICAPSGLHVDLAMEALAAGAHVIVEKPLDVSLPKARRLAAAAAESGRVVSVISQHRFDPASVAVARAIQTGRFGRITSAVASVAWWRAQAYYESGTWRGTWDLDGGGAVMNQGVHTVDLLVWFLGTPVEVTAHTALLAHRGIEVEDTAVALVRFASGALAVLHCTTAAFPGLTARIQVHGDAGSAVIDNDRLLYFHAADAAQKQGGQSSYGLAGGGNQADQEVGSAGAAVNTRGADDLQTSHQAQYADVLRAIRDATRPTVGIQEGTLALATVRAVYVSATLGRPVLVDEVLAGAFDDVVAHA